MLQRVVWLPACLLLAGCPGNSTSGPAPEVVINGTMPGGTYRITCAAQVSFQGTKISFGGLEIPITRVPGAPTVKVGTIDVDPQVYQVASTLIETLDQAHLTFCDSLPFSSPETVQTNYLNVQTQQLALSTLFTNINAASDSADVRNAVIAAGKLASTATTPPTPASPAPPGAAAPASPAALPAAAAPTSPAAPAATAAPKPPPATGATGATQAAAALQAAANAAKALP